MQQWNVIYLVSYAESDHKDEYGDTVIEETRRKVYARAKSISQTEFYQAQTEGQKPQIKFILATERDYENEEELVYNGIRYKVQRTYINERDEIEITCYGGVRDVYTENSN